VEATDVLTLLGGVATREALLRRTTRAEVDRAIRTGAITVVARGRYAMPEVGHAAREAHRLGGVLCRESAALHHGWP
jgi:hypothetical protein